MISWLTRFFRRSDVAEARADAKRQCLAVVEGRIAELHARIAKSFRNTRAYLEGQAMELEDVARKIREGVRP